MQTSFALAQLLVVAKPYPGHKTAIEESFEDRRNAEPPRWVDQHQRVTPAERIDYKLHVGVALELRLCVLFKISTPLFGREERGEATSPRLGRHVVQVDPADLMASTGEAFGRSIRHSVREGRSTKRIRTNDKDLRAFAAGT